MCGMFSSVWFQGGLPKDTKIFIFSKGSDLITSLCEAVCLVGLLLDSMATARFVRTSIEQLLTDESLSKISITLNDSYLKFTEQTEG